MTSDATIAAYQGEASAALIAAAIAQEKLNSALSSIQVLARERDEMEAIAERSHDDILRLSREVNELVVKLRETKERMIELGDVKEVYRVLLVAGMREVVRLSNAPDKPAAAIAYYAKLFELAQQSGELDKCNPDAVEAVATLAGVPIEYYDEVPA